MPAPPALALQSEEMDGLMTSYQFLIRDGEFAQAKLTLLKFMRVCTHSYIVCEKLERANSDAE